MNHNVLSKGETRAWIILAVLVLFVGTFISVRTTQQVQKTVKATDLIAQCTTPGTTCAKLSDASRIANQEFQKATIQNTTLCLGIASREAGPTDTALLEQKFNECVAAKVPLPPAPLTSTTPITISKSPTPVATTR